MIGAKIYYPVCFLLITFLLTASAHAVGGISNTKILVPSTETVPMGSFEIEPFLAAQFIDDNSDSRFLENGARFTAGTRKNLEIGVSVSYLVVNDDKKTDAEYNPGDISPGLKYRFYEYYGKYSFSLAYQGGFTIPTGDDSLWLFEPAGLIITTHMSPRFSVDSDVVLFFDEEESRGVNGNIGAGYFISEIFQPVIEAGFEYVDRNNGSSESLVNITGGFTAEITEYITMITGLTGDIVNDNTDRAVTFNLAFTFLF